MIDPRGDVKFDVGIGAVGLARGCVVIDCCERARARIVKAVPQQQLAAALEERT